MKKIGICFAISVLAAFCAACDDGESASGAQNQICNKICKPDNGVDQVCVSLDGIQSCKPACGESKIKGENSGCLHDDNTGKDNQVVVTCDEDDFHTLYVAQSQTVPCDNGCTQGKCNSNGGQDECDLTCTGNTREEVCVMISGQKSCKPSCQGSVVGENPMACLENLQTHSWMEVKDTCAMDELGTLYAAESQSNNCPEGCISGTGCSALVQECTQSCMSEGGRSETCTIIEGTMGCSKTCMGTNTGENPPKCWKNASMGPSAKWNSVVDTCALDDNGVLYMTDTQSDICPGNCVDGTGCLEVKPCTKDCNYAGGSPKVCTIVDGEENCRNSCGGGFEGENAPYCWRSASLGPSAKWQIITETCARDDNGVLYAASRDSQICNGTCEDGECEPLPECTLDCMNAGGFPQVCTIINGVQACKNSCMGEFAGENEPRCWRNASLGPSAKWNAITDTCEADDLGVLYSVDRDSETCSGKCEDDTGCKSTSCTKTCLTAGGRSKVCTVIDEVQECRTKCFGDWAGENPVHCWKSTSLGPSAKWVAYTDTCEQDDAMVAYMVSTVSETCTGNCTEGVGCDN